MRTKNNEEGRPLDRRHKPKYKDGLYRLIIIINSLAWGILVAALITFHFARPEFVSGVQEYWGLEASTGWSREHVTRLFTLLQLCLGLSLVTMLLRARRTRRRNDYYGINLFILVGISAVSLFTLYINVM
ncbi:hypothetical protein OPS25_05085 [Alteromonas ponticola]|uniref:DUF1648 domain-containing protein n=1 Tax=Alteromonas aquimaris TaxID=2998417 RepID=A0ABT3P516_9ALTE|nr:hypothetical protein [Alteromonas aquimaris]MCW8107871.1 hypothetical protein [Alteromonas aquimaris]